MATSSSEVERKRHRRRRRIARETDWPLDSRRSAAQTRPPARRRRNEAPVLYRRCHQSSVRSQVEPTPCRRGSTGRARRRRSKSARRARRPGTRARRSQTGRSRWSDTGASDRPERIAHWSRRTCCREAAAAARWTHPSAGPRGCGWSDLRLYRTRGIYRRLTSRSD